MNLNALQRAHFFNTDRDRAWNLTWIWKMKRCTVLIQSAKQICAFQWINLHHVENSIKGDEQSATSDKRMVLKRFSNLDTPLVRASNLSSNRRSCGSIHHSSKPLFARPVECSPVMLAPVPNMNYLSLYSTTFPRHPLVDRRTARTIC